MPKVKTEYECGVEDGIKFASYDILSNLLEFTDKNEFMRINKGNVKYLLKNFNKVEFEKLNDEDK
jgi:hypothetical protein